MSIFKETFPRYVENQLRVREAIISQKFKRINGTKGSQKAKLKNGKKVELPPGAFYTNTVSKQCTIRMYSGVDINESSDFLNKKYTSDKAKRFILEGGIPVKSLNKKQTARTNPQTDEPYTEQELADIRENRPNMDDDTFNQKYYGFEGEYEDNLGYPVRNRLPRKGFIGKEGSAYGDPTIFADPDNEFGAVPMPGIIDANIRTTSAYGSLREAKVNFVCHNRRQLEVLEMLYMRPGYPVLIEWGWLPYIGNDGKKENFIPYFEEFFNSNNDLEKLQELIRAKKQEHSGNWDGFIGYCKNFEFKSRSDGGYDCSTNIIAMGDVLDGLKARRDGFSARESEGTIKYYDNFEYFMIALKEWMSAVDLWFTDSDKMSVGTWDDHDYSTNAMNVSDWDTQSEQKTQTRWLKDILITRRHLVEALQKLAGFVDPTSTPIYIYDRNDDAQLLADYKRAISTAKLEHVSGGGAVTKQSATQIWHQIRDYIRGVGSANRKSGGGSKNIWGQKSPDVIKEMIRLEEILDKFVIKKNEGIGIKGEEADHSSGESLSRRFYIRWDFLVYIMNEYVLPKYTSRTTSTYNNIVELTCYHYNEPYNNDNIYLDYMRSFKESPSIPTEGNEMTIDRKDTSSQNRYGMRTDSSFNLENVFDTCLNPSVAIFPHQMWREGSNYWSMPYDDTSSFDVTISKSVPASKATHNSIGLIMISLDHLLKVYRGMRYDNEDGLNDDFSILEFLKKIWEKDINSACANQHNFILQADKDNSTIVRVIDAIYQSDLLPENLYEFKIQSNESIVRNFTFNSTIPSSLSSTIAIASQNPSSIADLEAVTVAAMNKDTINRFFYENKDDWDYFYQRWEEEVELVNKAQDLWSYILAIQRGNYDETKSIERPTEIDTSTSKMVEYEDIDVPKYLSVKQAVNHVARIKDLISILQSKYPLVDNKGRFFMIKDKISGGKRRDNFSLAKSAIIPLKYNCKMDGIGGIVIGNVFKVQSNRLPKGYQGRDVAFIVTSEQQTITAGQDWTTDISGQIMLLDIGTDKDSRDKTRKPEHYHGNLLSYENHTNFPLWNDPQTLKDEFDNNGLTVESFNAFQDLNYEKNYQRMILTAIQMVEKVVYHRDVEDPDVIAGSKASNHAKSDNTNYHNFSEKNDAPDYYDTHVFFSCDSWLKYDTSKPDQGSLQALVSASIDITTSKGTVLYSHDVSTVDDYDPNARIEAIREAEKAYFGNAYYTTKYFAHAIGSFMPEDDDTWDTYMKGKSVGEINGSTMSDTYELTMFEGTWHGKSNNNNVPDRTRPQDEDEIFNWNKSDLFIKKSGAAFFEPSIQCLEVEYFDHMGGGGGVLYGWGMWVINGPHSNNNCSRVPEYWLYPHISMHGQQPIYT